MLFTISHPERKIMTGQTYIFVFSPPYTPLKNKLYVVI